MAGFKWFEDLKKEKKQTNQRNSGYMPISGRYGFTGFGEDGINQPDNPTHMINTSRGPATLHEGEMTKQLPNGDMRVYSQEELRKMEQGGMQGYKCGGRVPMRYQEGGVLTPKQNPMANRTGPMANRKPDTRIGGTGDSNPILGGQGDSPTRLNVNPQSGRIPNIDFKAKDIKQPNVDPVQDTIIPDVGDRTIIPDVKIPDKVIPDVGPFTTKPDVTDQGFTTGPIGRIPDVSGQGFTTGPIGRTTGPIQFEEGVSFPVEDPDKIDPVQYQEWFKQAMEHYQNMLQNGDPAQRAQAQKYLDDLSARNATIQTALEQRMTQQGITGPTAEARRLMAGRDANMQFAEASAQMGIADLQSRNLAADRMADLAMKGMQFEEGSDQWQQGLDWQKEQFNKQFDFAMKQYGDEKGMRIARDINAGMSYDQIKAKYPNVSEADYKHMKEFSEMNWAQKQWNEQFDFQKEVWQKEFGLSEEKFDEMKKQWWTQYEHQKGVEAFNQLLQQGGEDNFRKASKMFNELYDTKIDFDNALTQENIGNFNQAMSQMSKYIASGMDWDEAKEAMKKDGTFDGLGMTNSDARDMYNAMYMANNQFFQADKMYQDLVDQGVITEDEYKDIMSLMKWGLTHTEGLQISDSYEVFTRDGRVENFETEQEAMDYLREHPELAKVGGGVRKVENGWIKQGDGDGDGTIPDVNEINSTIDYFGELGVEINEARAKEYLDAHGGKVPDGTTAEDFQKWDNSTGSASRINEWMSGSGTAQMTDADFAMLDDIKAAQEKVKEGNATAAEKELAKKVTDDMMDWGFKKDMKTRRTKSWNEDNMGKLHRTMEFDNSIYESQPGEYVKFRDEFKEWVNGNKGNVVQIEGKWYKIPSGGDVIKEKQVVDTKEIASGNDTYKQKFYGDTLTLINMENGEKIDMQFGTEGKLWD